LTALYEEIGAILSARLDAEKKVLEGRLRQLNPSTDDQGVAQSKRRRPYPAVQPKFRNPEQPSETWSGRGKQPRWLTAQVRSGKRIEDFRIGSRIKKRGD
jgi:DNA-binding protein H-NS